MQAMEKEKNAKVLALLQSALNIQESDRPEEALSKEELVKQLHKGGKKKSLAWAYEQPFEIVHDRGSIFAGNALVLCIAGPERCQ